nr:hypothetical protein BaRGS_004864 [Batillaria attramentaria]
MSGPEYSSGYLVNWDIERQVWDHMFGKDCCKVDFNETTLVVTEPCLNFQSIQEAMTEVLFEEYQFKAIYRCNAPHLSQYKYSKKDSQNQQCTLLVDSGYSFTHLVPFCKGKKLRDAVCRLNVGGKVLTNHLKEVISYRQLMVMDETYVVNQMKEDVCYVSANFTQDMNIARRKGAENTIMREYVLPDFSHIKRGYVRQKDDPTDKTEGYEQVPVLWGGTANHKWSATLLLLADKYEIAKLRETCLAYMTRHIVETADANRAVTWYLYAQMTGQTAFRDQCLSFILSNFDIVMKAVDWADLSLQELTGFLACSEMVVHSEAALWSYVEKWLLSENNKEDIESNLKEVLPLIRFTMMPPKSLLQVENSSLYRDHQQRFSGKLNHAYRRHSLVMDGGDETTSTSDSPREAYRNYYCEEYCLSHAFSLNGYADISKIESRITLDCSTRQRFVAPSRAKSEDLTLFSVYFFPRGYFTTLTIYGSYMGRQNNDVTLKVIRRRPDLLPMKVDVTLVLFGRQNGVKYAAFTHSCSMVFTKDNHTLSVEKFLDINSLMKENSPYLVDGNMEGTIFLKIQDVGNHLVKLEQGQE